MPLRRRVAEKIDRVHTRRRRCGRPKRELPTCRKARRGRPVLGAQLANPATDRDAGHVDVGVSAARVRRRVDVADPPSFGDARRRRTMQVPTSMRGGAVSLVLRATDVRRRQSTARRARDAAEQVTEWTPRRLDARRSNRGPRNTALFCVFDAAPRASYGTDPVGSSKISRSARRSTERIPERDSK